jgi:hypothetical protein
MMIKGPFKVKDDSRQTQNKNHIGNNHRNKKYQIGEKEIDNISSDTVVLHLK